MTTDFSHSQQTTVEKKKGKITETRQTFLHEDDRERGTNAGIAQGNLGTARLGLANLHMLTQQESVPRNSVGLLRVNKHA